MERPEAYARAIRAGMSYTGQRQEDLARRMGIHKDTLGRKLRDPRNLTLGDLEKADAAVKWSKHMEGMT